MLYALAMAAYLSAYDPYSSAIGIRQVPALQPTVGQDATATIGDKLVWTETFRLSEGAVTTEEVHFSVNGVSLSLRQGSKLYRITTSRAYKACTVDALLGEDHPCLIDDEGDGRFDRVAKDFFDSAKPLPIKVSYSKSLDIALPPASSGFVREIRYQGATPDTLRLSYREFNDDLARQAFTEDLSVPLGNHFPQSVALKGLVVSIKAIGSMGIIYSIDQVRPDSGWNSELTN